MRVGILTGSFNPIHIGHQVMVNVALNCGLFDKILVVVSNNPWKKDKADMASFDDRFNMVKLAFRDVDNVEISDIERTMDNHYTCNVLTRLQEDRPDDVLSLIIGLDNVFCFDQWKNPEIISANFNVYYMKRDVVSGEKAIQNAREFHMKEIDCPDINISSTCIRELTRKRQPCFGFVHKDVLEYMLKKELYHY